MKKLFIAEKPSVAVEFAKAMNINPIKRNGYIEGNDVIITWCVGHLVSMSYPAKYDEKYKRWSLDTLPFLPKQFKYEVISGVNKQFEIVKNLLNRDDVDSIYICTDSGREGEYIYRLVDEKANVKGKKRLRVWIDSQTEEEIMRGIKEAKDWSFYDNLAESAYLRAKEDYLMGINFSRVLTLKYGNTLANILKLDRAVLSVGRVMTCVLGMVVRREREIRDFTKMPFYKLNAIGDKTYQDTLYNIDMEWKVSESSIYYNHPDLYKENGFKSKKEAQNLISNMKNYIDNGGNCIIDNIERKTEKKNPPLLYNLAELQNECSKKYKISPDETLKIVQNLYEAKLVTYPRTDARVLSKAVAKEIHKNINGLLNVSILKEYAKDILDNDRYKNLSKTKYVDDSKITDHYAIIPTGVGINKLNTFSNLHTKIYYLIAKRFLSIFYPPAKYKKINIDVKVDTEHLYSSYKVCDDLGYLALYTPKKEEKNKIEEQTETNDENDETQNNVDNPEFIEMLKKFKKSDVIDISDFSIKEGETTPPKRYTSGSIILAMENAGQLIEDEELRSQIKGSGIGTSATRAEILKKLCKIKYLSLNNKTQGITPTLFGEMVYEVVNSSMKQLLNPELTASWEKGLNYVANGSITSKEYMEKLEHFVGIRTNNVKNIHNQYILKKSYDDIVVHYKKKE